MTTTTRCIRIHETGGPDVLRWDDVTVAAPGEGEVRLRHGAIGLNYIDTYQRTGLYPLPSLPAVLGMEGAGEVVEVGAGVSDLRVGDRVAYAGGPVGAYAEERLMPAERLVPLPENIEIERAAAMMLKGMTVEYLLRRAYRVESGETLLIHAAAGGVGLLACQWAKHLGATVIGTVGSEEKAALAREHGCDHPILYRSEDFVRRVRELTSGEGVPVVYDSVGRDTFDGSLACLRPRGMLVSFGQSSGKIPPLDIGRLSAGGSLFLTRPSLMDYTARREDLLESASALFGVVSSDAVRVEVRQTYPLAEAARAHRDLEARKTSGATILVP